MSRWEAPHDSRTVEEPLPPQYEAQALSAALKALCGFAVQPLPVTFQIYLPSHCSFQVDSHKRLSCLVPPRAFQPSALNGLTKKTQDCFSNKQEETKATKSCRVSLCTDPPAQHKADGLQRAAKSWHQRSPTSILPTCQSYIQYQEAPFLCIL